MAELSLLRSPSEGGNEFKPSNQITLSSIPRDIKTDIPLKTLEINQEERQEPLFQRSVSSMVKLVTKPTYNLRKVQLDKSFWRHQTLGLCLGASIFFAATGVLYNINTTALLGNTGEYSGDFASAAEYDCSDLKANGLTSTWAGELLGYVYDYYSSFYTDNEVAYSPQHTYPLSTVGHFAINIKIISRMTFLQAKTVDVLWNLVAGQGLRFIMGYITYILYCDILTLFLERSRVSYGFYNAVGFDVNSINGFVQTIKELFSSPHIHRFKTSWIILIWMTLSIIYTLSIPSLLGATAGYINPTQTWWQLPDQSLVFNLTEATQACWTINNGSRLGLSQYSDGSIISGPLWQPLANKFGQGSTDHKFCLTDPWEINTTSSLGPDTGYPLFDDISRYICEFPSYDPSESTNITINNTLIQIPAPPLTFGPLSASQPDTYGTGVFQRCRNGTLWPKDYIPPAMCIAIEDGYAWGFSQNLSVSIFITQGVWFMITWFFWYYINIKSDRVRQKRTFRGHIRTSLYLVESMYQDLGTDLNRLSEKELDKALAKQSGISLNVDRNTELRCRY